jgi:predicted transposase/invertase (TIGR01784 family)
MNADEQQKTMHPRHDTSYRFLLSSKKLFVELLRSFVHRGWVKAIDETNVQEIPHSFVLQDFRRKEADLVYQVKLNNEDVVFYLLLEMQSKVDFEMPYRLLLYQMEVWEYWLKNHVKKKERKRKSFRLPAIVPMVLYNGKAKWTASRQFRKLLSNEQIFGAELIDFEYFLVDVVRYTEEELLSLANVIGSVFLLDQTEDREQLRDRLRRLMDTMQKLPEESQQHFFTWMANILVRKLPKDQHYIEELIQHVEEGVSVMGFENILDDIKREGKMEGRLEGERKGRLEGERKGRLEGERRAKEEVAKQLMKMGSDTSYIVAVTGFTEGEVEKLRKPSPYSSD